MTGYDLSKTTMWMIIGYMFVLNFAIYSLLYVTPTNEILQRYIVPQMPTYGMTMEEKEEYAKEFQDSLLIRQMGDHEENHIKFAAAQKDRFARIASFLEAQEEE